MPTVAVLTPTHDHQDTLYASIASIQQQTFQDFEILVIGDGSPDRTRQIMAELCAADSRIRYFDFPKGPRHGEIYRDQLLRTETNAPYICYLSDDDLWLPHHLEVMTQALQKVEFVHTLHTNIHVDNSVVSLPHNLHSPASLEQVKRLALGAFGLSYGAHRRETYLALPQGWQTTPVGCTTDLYMWAKFLRAEVSFASVLLPTCLHLPAPERLSDSPAQRLDELKHWLGKSRDAGFIQTLWQSIFYAGSYLLNHIDTSSITTFSDLLSLHQLEVQQIEQAGYPTLTELLERDLTRPLIALTAEQYAALELQCLQQVKQISPAQAKARWIQLFAQSPADPKVRLAMARCFVQSAEWQVVEELLALHQPPEHYTEEHINLYVNALIQQGKLDKAEQILVACLHRAPFAANLLMKLAEIKVQSNQPNAAIQILETAAAQDRKLKAPILRQLAQLQMQLGNYQAALQAARQVIELQPYEPTAYLQAGISAFHLTNYEEALRFLDQTLELNPQQATAYVHKCQVLMLQQQIESARAVALTGLAHSPAHVGILLQLGISEFHLANYPAALQSFDQVLQLEPARSGAYIHKCQTLIQLQQPEQAKTAALTGLSHCPNEPSLWVQLGLSYFHLGDYEAALPEFDRALALDPQRLGAYIHKCQTLIQLQQPEQAKAVAEQGLAHFPASRALQTYRDGG